MFWISGFASMFIAVFAWAICRNLLSIPFLVATNPRGAGWPTCAFIANSLAATIAVYAAFWISTNYIFPTAIYFLVAAAVATFLIMNAQMAGVAESASLMEEWTIDESATPAANATLRERHAISCNAGTMFGTILGFVGAIVACVVVGPT